MYGIFITCWYQERGGITQVEQYHSLEFEDIDDACKYLGKNIEEIYNWYPLESVEIKLIK